MTALIWACSPWMDLEGARHPVQVRAWDVYGSPISEIRCSSDLSGAIYAANSPSDLRTRVTFSGILDSATAPVDCTSLVWVGLDGQKPADGIDISTCRLRDFYPRCLAVRSDGLVFVAGSRLAVQRASNNNYLNVLPGPCSRVFTPGGQRVAFPDLHGTYVAAIAVTDTRIYVGGGIHSTGNAMLRGYDSGGLLLWSAAAENATTWLDEVRSIQVLSDGRLLVHGGMVYGDDYNTFDHTWVACYSSSGVRQWRLNADRTTTLGYYKTTKPIVDEARGIAYISGGPWIVGAYRYGIVAVSLSTGTIALTGEASGDNYHLSIGASGLIRGYRYSAPGEDPAWDWRDLAADTLASVATGYLGIGVSPQLVDHAEVSGGTVFGLRTGERPVSSGYGSSTVYLEHLRYATIAGAQPWEGLNARGMRGVFTSSDVSGYSLGAEIPDAFRETSISPLYSTLTYSSRWGVTAGPDYGGYPITRGGWGLLGVHASEHAIMPAVRMGLDLGLPTWQGDSFSTAPGIPLGIALRTPTVQREYVGALALPAVYRAQIGGSLWVRVSSASIRRTTMNSTLTLVCPIESAAMVSDVLALYGLDLVLWRGVRFPGGQEQLDPLMTVPLDSIRADSGASSGSLTLSGAVTEAPVAIGARTLRGISYRATQAGARRVRCEVDTYLAPGDTALLGGGETMIVAEISVSISPVLATMDLAE